MVKSIELFREYFRNFTDQYVLIGGAACDVLFESNNADFRVTRDLDIVLIVEALTVAESGINEDTPGVTFGCHSGCPNVL